MNNISKDRFNDILRRYRSGECTAEERHLIDSWYDSIQEVPDIEGQDSEEGVRLNQKMWDTIREKAFSERHVATRRIPRARVTYYSLAAAAVIAAVIIAFVFITPPSGLPAGDVLVSYGGAQVPLKEVSNQQDEPKTVVLPDGSSVQLERGSKVIFPERFTGNDRKISFEGEGFFQIEKDPSCPFYVYTTNVVTKVLGTSFVIKALERDAEIVVAVKTGRVSVYTHNESESGNATLPETILTPNQQAVYSKPKHTLSRMLVEDPQPLVTREKLSAIHFENAPISEIFRTIEEVYEIKIDFDEELFAECKLTTSISDGGIFDRLNIICTAMRATYKVEDTHIVIQGAGCGR